jgi:hypothetical protein
MTPRQPYDWAVIKIPESSLSIVHSTETVTLEERYRKVHTLLDTQKIYCVVSSSKNEVQTKVFSEVNLFNIAHTVHFQTEVYQVEDIKGSITCEYDRK